MIITIIIKSRIYQSLQKLRRLIIIITIINLIRVSINHCNTHNLNYVEMGRLYIKIICC